MSLMNFEQERHAHPVDVIEQIASLHDWSFERAGEDEIAISVGGNWADYHVSFSWMEEREALHLACAFDLKVPENRQLEVMRLLSAVNEQLWIGHFDLWKEEGIVMFRQALLLSGGADPNAPTGGAPSGHRNRGLRALFPGLSICRLGGAQRIRSARQRPVRDRRRGVVSAKGSTDHRPLWGRRCHPDWRRASTCGSGVRNRFHGRAREYNVAFISILAVSTTGPGRRRQDGRSAFGRVAGGRPRSQGGAGFRPGPAGRLACHIESRRVSPPRTNRVKTRQPAAIVVAVKPQISAAVLPIVRPLVGSDTVALSIAAGTTLAALEQGLGPMAIVRAMPNTPAQIGRGNHRSGGQSARQRVRQGPCYHPSRSGRRGCVARPRGHDRRGHGSLGIRTGLRIPACGDPCRGRRRGRAAARDPQRSWRVPRSPVPANFYAYPICRITSCAGMSPRRAGRRKLRWRF